MWAALRGAHQEICVHSVFQEMQIVPAAARSVLLGKRVSMTNEYLQVTDADIKMRARNFSTELKHLKLRSSVRRISVPSQIAEVSS
jgi:predicted Zn-dependent protease